MRYLTLLFTLFLSFNGTLFSQATIYKTSSDFGIDKTIDYKNVILEKGILVLISTENKKIQINLKEEKIWGFRNKWGEDYRIDKKGNAQRIIEFGDICVYSRQTDRIENVSSPEIDGIWEDNPYRLSKKNSFSIGVDGKMIKFKKERFLKSLQANFEVYTKFEKYVDSNFDELLIKVIEHNAEMH